MQAQHTPSTLLTCVAEATSYRKCVYSPVNSAMSPQNGIASPDSSLFSLVDTVPSEYSSDYYTVPVYQPSSHTSSCSTIFKQYATTWPHMYPASSITNLEFPELFSMFKTKLFITLRSNGMSGS